MIYYTEKEIKTRKLKKARIKDTGSKKGQIITQISMTGKNFDGVD